MSQINLNVAHISDVNIRDFADFSNLGGDQKAVIRVNSNTFAVSVLADGNVSVNFKGGFFNLLRGKTRERLANHIRAQVDAWKAATAKPDEGALKTTIAGNTEKAIGTLFPAESGNIDAHGAEVAVYGFSTVRQANFESAEKLNIKYSMIDDYNAGLGLRPQTVTLPNIAKRLEEIRSGSCNFQAKHSGIPKEKLNAWLQFLQRPENMKKLDILGRLREYITIGDKPSKADKKLTGWKGEFARGGSKLALESFVRKNLPGECLNTELDEGGTFRITDIHVKLLAKALNYLVTQFEGKENNASVNGSIVQAAEDLGMELDDEEVLALNIALDGIVGNAFFRQTSKMGLDFFRENKIPVMFYWTNYQGQSMPDDNRAVTGRWWKDAGDSVQNHYGASITFSEMRHVQKMTRLEQDGEQMNFAKIMGLKV